MNSEHVEVLREMKGWRMPPIGGSAYNAALDAAIASLSAPQPPSEAQAVGGGERKPDGFHYRYRDPYGGEGTIIRNNSGQEVNGSWPIEAVPYWYSAPPSAPVGVEVLARGHFHPDPDGGNDWEWFDGDAGAGCTECVRAVIIPAAALAQQPAAVDEVRILRKLADRVMTALGKFTSDEGWSAVDMETADDFGALAGQQEEG